MPRKKNREVETFHGPRAAAAKLRRLADCLEAGRPFRIRVAGETLRVPTGARFSVAHEREGGTEELELQLTWERGR